MKLVFAFVLSAATSCLWAQSDHQVGISISTGVGTAIDLGPTDRDVYLAPSFSTQLYYETSINRSFSYRVGVSHSSYAYFSKVAFRDETGTFIGIAKATNTSRYFELNNAVRYSFGKDRRWYGRVGLNVARDYEFSFYAEPGPRNEVDFQLDTWSRNRWTFLSDVEIGYTWTLSSQLGLRTGIRQVIGLAQTGENELVITGLPLHSMLEVSLFYSF